MLQLRGNGGEIERCELWDIFVGYSKHTWHSMQSSAES
jgi:hypothetical protein